MSAAEAIAAVVALVLLTFCGGAQSDNTTTVVAQWTNNNNVAGNSSVIYTTVASAVNSSSTTASPTDNSTVIAVSVTLSVLVVLAIVAVALYFLWFRKWRQRRQGSEGDTTEKKTGNAANAKGIKMRYSTNPSRQLAPPQSVTGDYVTVPGGGGEERVYENLSGASKAPLSAQQSHNYENIPPEIAALALKAKKPKKPAAVHSDGARRTEERGSVADDSLPSYRAPPPPASGHVSADASMPIGQVDRAKSAITAISGDNAQSGYVVFQSRTDQAPKKKKKTTISSPPAPSGRSSEEPIYGNTEQQQQSTVALSGRPPKVKPSSVATAAAWESGEAGDSTEDTYFVPEKKEEEKHAPTVPSKPALSAVKKPASSAAKKPESSAVKKPATQTAPKPPTSAGFRSVGAMASASGQPPINDDDTYIAPEAEDEMYVAPEDELYVN